ncbi:MAG: DUF3795 domain-containing protein [Clostridia bacterium]|nr:DUF3795 domain-containing protein [Clostridia bacterium]
MCYIYSIKEYVRTHPELALCGLSCALCPRYHTDGASKCPGCGGKDFHLLHPSCTIINCSKAHGNIDYCCDCTDYPCKRFDNCGQLDSFITYRNVISDFQRLREIGETAFLSILSQKEEILLYLINNHNDGKSKAFFCLAVNLLPLNALLAVNIELKTSSRTARELLNNAALELGIELKLKTKLSN